MSNYKKKKHEKKPDEKGGKPKEKDCKPGTVHAADDPIGGNPNDPDNDGDDDTGGENPVEPPGNP